MTDDIRVALAGATGYAGAELARLLLLHPRVTLCRVTSEQHAGKRFDEVLPAFTGHCDLVLESLDSARLAEGVDVVFTALPHGTSAPTVVAAIEAGAKVIDLGADFRLRDLEVFEAWYGSHAHPDWVAQAVYGVPEFAREQLRGASLVANPGCYPTGAIFGLVPLARAGAIDGAPVIVDAKSGVSGAGRTARADLLFGEVAENFRPYSVGKHRHTPEIIQEIVAAGGPERVVFTPHLVPMRRGISTTIYAPIEVGRDLDAIFQTAYAAEPFIHLLGEGRFPEVRDVRATNDVQIGWTTVDAGRTAIIVTAIDNLGRGAAGQAVQNLNAVHGWDETLGLRAIAPVP